MKRYVTESGPAAPDYMRALKSVCARHLPDGMFKAKVIQINYCILIFFWAWLGLFLPPHNFSADQDQQSKLMFNVTLRNFKRGEYSALFSPLDKGYAYTVNTLL